jgi:2-phospho-L-lactate guanylyltransferase
MLVMLEDVLAALQHVAQLDPVLVVTTDDTVAGIAARFGAQVLREASDRGHSHAAIAGFACAQSQGAVRALALPADAPLVTSDELRSLVEIDPALAGPGVTLVPNQAGEGTNGFLVSPPGVLQPSFGPGSFARHRAHAAEHGIECRVRHLPGLALDIDEPSDLARLIAQKRGDHRYEFLGARNYEGAMESQ